MSRGSWATGAWIAVAAACAIACAACSLSFPDKDLVDGDADTGADTAADTPWDQAETPTDPGWDEGDAPPDVTPDGLDADTEEGGPDIGEDTETPVSPDDWDGDCISNSLEDALGTDPWDWDSDDDGSWDFVEGELGTDALNALDNPGVHGDYAFVMPYDNSPAPGKQTIVLTNLSVEKLDMFVLLDVTGSMGGELANLQASFETSIAPQVSSIVADSYFGFGVFADYPLDPYGATGDVVFDLGHNVDGLPDVVQMSIDAASILFGGDGPEGAVPALWAVATGGGLGSYLAAAPACPGGLDGYPCFREDALPLVAMITDAEFHNGPGSYAQYTGIDPAPPTYTDARFALAAIDAKVACWETSNGSGAARSHCDTLATDTGSVSSSGVPFVASGSSDGTGLSSGLVGLVSDMIAGMPLEVTLRVYDPPGGTDLPLVFPGWAEADVVGGVTAPDDPGATCASGLAAEDRDGDTRPDTFTSVMPGTSVCFDLYAGNNNEVENEPLHSVIFAVEIQAIGNGRYLLDSRDLYYIVPPEGCDVPPREAL